MKDINSNFDPQLANLDREEWYDAVEELAEEDGYFEPLGKNYSTIFHEAGPRLIVTFETFGEVFARRNREPRGFDMVRRNGWSHLCILSDGGRWYRDQRIYRYFDRLVDDGFFEDFDQVLFFGDGPGGYAAAAYSVVAPGANVLAIRPVATLDPAQAGWDRRFIKDRQLSFSDRYGYAPDMLEAAAKAFVVFDPRNREDAMHAALFRAPNVLGLQAFGLGVDILPALDGMGALEPLIEGAMDGSLDTLAFARHYRGRQHRLEYLRPMLNRLESSGRIGLAARMCRGVLKTQKRPRFAKALARFEAALHNQA